MNNDYALMIGLFIGCLAAGYLSGLLFRALRQFAEKI